MSTLEEIIEFAKEKLGRPVYQSARTDVGEYYELLKAIVGLEKK